MAHILPGEGEGAASVGLAEALAEELTERGFRVGRTIFLDDMVAHQRWQRWVSFYDTAMQMSTDRLAATWTELGRPVAVLLESDMIEVGQRLLLEIQAAAEVADDARMSADGRTVIFGRGAARERIKLTGYRDHPDLPSCEVLDLAAYEHKLADCDIAVTVLPETYRAQQGRVQRLMRLLGRETPIMTVFHDTDGTVTEIMRWSPDREDEYALNDEGS